jgi:hypothetical protein
MCWQPLVTGHDPTVTKLLSNRDRIVRESPETAFVTTGKASTVDPLHDLFNCLQRKFSDGVDPDMSFSMKPT